MTDNRFRMPRDNRAVGSDGRLTQAYQHYLGGIEALAGRRAGAVADTSGATLTELEASLNALKAALRAADLLEG
jgi:hypothetical protein